MDSYECHTKAGVMNQNVDLTSAARGAIAFILPSKVLVTLRLTQVVDALSTSLETLYRLHSDIRKF